MINVIVDTLGAERGERVCIEGAVTALGKYDDLGIIFVGRENSTKEILKDLEYDEKRVRFINAEDEIGCGDKPTDAIRYRKESSMYKAIELIKADESINALVTAGSSGAILAGATLKIGRIKGVRRPAFCPLLPTMKRGVVGVCDSGANVECDSLQLAQFALMGSLYIQKAYGVEKPKVALLNVGTEEEKGDELRKETYKKLKETAEINFVGNMESRDLLKGDYDLVVCDGFSGNVLIKSTEGACLEMLKMLKSIMTKNLKNKLGALLLKKDVMEIKDFMDYNNYPGAVILGCKKTVVKSHGSSKSVTMFKSIELAYKIEKAGLNASIAEKISETLAAE